MTDIRSLMQVSGKDLATGMSEQWAVYERYRCLTDTAQTNEVATENLVDTQRKSDKCKFDVNKREIRAEEVEQVHSLQIILEGSCEWHGEYMRFTTTCRFNNFATYAQLRAPECRFAGMLQSAENKMGVSRRFHCRTLTAVLDVPILSCVLLCFEMADLVGLIYAGLIVTGGVVGYVKAGSTASLASGLAFGAVLGYSAHTNNTALLLWAASFDEFGRQRLMDGRRELRKQCNSCCANGHEVLQQWKDNASWSGHCTKCGNDDPLCDTHVELNGSTRESLRRVRSLSSGNIVIYSVISFSGLSFHLTRFHIVQKCSISTRICFPRHLK
uniref:Complex I-B14.7 n=1 Tax=Ascaris lumbricoides TaxID=6252 RepID=A0A0M3HSU2_ASCLU